LSRAVLTRLITNVSRQSLPKSNAQQKSPFLRESPSFFFFRLKTVGLNTFAKSVLASGFCALDWFRVQSCVWANGASRASRALFLGPAGSGYEMTSQYDDGFNYDKPFKPARSLQLLTLAQRFLRSNSSALALMLVYERTVPLAGRSGI